MGNTQTHGLQPQVLTSLKKQTGFTYGEISDLYRQFKIDSKNLSMTLSQFNEMYREVFPHGEPDKLSKCVFSTFDKKGHGEIDFREFLDALSVQLKGTVKMRYEWVYDVVNYQGPPGKVDKTQVMDIITILNNLYAGLLPEDITSPEDFCQVCVQSITAGSQTGSDVITKKDFVNAAMLTSTVRQLADAVVKAAMTPYEVRRERTGSIGRPRSDSMRARTLTSQDARQQTRARRTNTIS